jgi:hypothetical protein
MLYQLPSIKLSRMSIVPPLNLNSRANQLIRGLKNGSHANKMAGNLCSLLSPQECPAESEDKGPHNMQVHAIYHSLPTYSNGLMFLDPR